MTNGASWHLVLPGSLDATTGGTRYDRRVVQGLAERELHARVHELPGAYPALDDAARHAAALAFDAIPDGAVAVVDGLALGALPEVAEAHGGRLTLVGLVHHPLADETGLAPDARDALLHSERRALAHARAVVVTSAPTARRLDELDLVPEGTPTRVVEPGVDFASASPPRAAGEACRLLSVGALTPRKALDDAVNALGGLKDLAWTWTVVGRIDQDPASADATRALVERLELSERVEITGELDDASLERRFAEAHVLVHPARYEGYGMAVAEALARAVPVVASTGGALAETAPDDATLRFAPGDVDALRDRLRLAIDDGSTYARLRAGAESARSTARPWSDATDELERVLDEVGR